MKTPLAMVLKLQIPLILAHHVVTFAFSWTIPAGTLSPPISLYPRRYRNGDILQTSRPSSVIKIPPEEASLLFRLHRHRHDLCLQSSSQTNTEIEKIHPNEPAVDISIDYCSACQWTLRATWLASEVLTTFANEPRLHSVSLVPRSPPLSEGGIFSVVSASLDDSVAGSSFEANASRRMELVLWDRKKEGRFPEAKEIKQSIRDVVNPDKDLGHSDGEKSDTRKISKENDRKVGECIECKEQEQLLEKSNSKSLQPKRTHNSSGESKEVVSEPNYPSIFYQYNKVSIEYSTGESIASVENGLYRASWYANELLSMVYARNAWWKTIQQDQQQKQCDDCADDAAPLAVDCVTLIPNRLDSGVLKIVLNDEIVIHNQASSNSPSFIDASELRTRVCHFISNHSNSTSVTTTSTSERSAFEDDSVVGIEMMNEEEAEDARRFFGVF
mmetsp:Transcript_2804/g.5608  ORF Transcript_2804/g.5608 Transcript_2804/m.5608 type:complete len:443 (-) Transcript_2804:223-1551(-)